MQLALETSYYGLPFFRPTKYVLTLCIVDKSLWLSSSGEILTALTSS